jgi:redox-sensitive bicupin YhaK (pirin superfamily)
MNSLEMIITGRSRDLGGFSVRRILPYATHRMVGPFIFFDHMGPADFPPGKGIDVRPHPHIHLATVTYLFDGKIRHRDSLGSDQLIEPGAINWMTAGRGIVHSERAPEDFLATGGRLNGIQCWVALPEGSENVDPTFVHHPAAEFPEFGVEGGARMRLLLGTAFGRSSPVRVHSDIFYLDAVLPAGGHLDLDFGDREAAVYVAEGRTQIEGEGVAAFSMAVGKPGRTLRIEAVEKSRLMLLGGAPLSKRFIYWNFVSSSEESIEIAKADWANGPGAVGSRFPRVPGDEADFIPLPNEPRNPRGTIM